MFIVIDYALRISAVVGLFIVWIFWLAICVMGTDSGTREAMFMSLLALFIGSTLVAGLMWAAIYSNQIQNWLVGSSWYGYLLVRGPIYLLAVVLVGIIVRQYIQTN
ncbi:hypothetical protein BZJ17_14750 [Salinivibrio sp. IB574]|nr:hypothetical protein BZJ17_14750 [Salinivibrio sp. IB574]